MTRNEQIAELFQRLGREGYLSSILAVISDARLQYRGELEGLLGALLLTDEPTRARVYALQGQIKTCDELLATMDTLGRPGTAA